MFLRKLILLLFAAVLLAPVAGAKTVKTPKPNRHHKVRSHKAKVKSPKARWGNYKAKNKHS